MKYEELQQEVVTLKETVDELKNNLAEFKRNRLIDLTTNEVEIIRESIFDRTAATLASGASLDRYGIISLNGKRGAVPFYDKFTPMI